MADGNARSVPGKQTAGRSQGRPSKRLLDRERITDAAMSLIRTSGTDALTMAELAGSLGVTAPALYNHASSKLVTLRWVEDRLMDLVEVGDFSGGDWRGALQHWATSYRQVMVEHAAFIRAIATMPVAGAPLTLAMYEQVAKGLASCGWPDEALAPVTVAVESFVYGSAYDVTAPADIFHVDQDEHDQAPTFVRGVAVYTESAGADRRADAAFEIGLAALLSGLASQYGVASA